MCAVSSNSSSQSPAYQSTSSSSSSSYSTNCGCVSFHEIAFSMRAAASESSDRSKLSTAAATASDFLALASLAASAASLHCVPKAPARCGNFQLLPMLSPSAPVVPLVANTDENLLEDKPDVSASKIPRMFSCRTSLLISEFEAFQCLTNFPILQCESTCPLSHGFTIISSKRIKSEEIHQQLNTFLN